jgi:hypothetical protein
MLLSGFARYLRFRWAFFPFCLLLAITSCQVAPGVETIFANDFEQDGRRQPTPPGLSTNVAHSGEYSAKLDPATDYAGGWNAAWGDIGEPHKIQVRAWVYLPNGRLKNVMVVEVKRGETTRYWKLLPINQVIKRYGQWEPVHKTFVLPRDMEANDQVRVYAWHFDERQTWYLDDVSIERVE